MRVELEGKRDGGARDEPKACVHVGPPVSCGLESRLYSRAGFRARTLIEVAALPRHALIEIEAWAYLPAGNR